jgi:hypothetical protein
MMCKSGRERKGVPEKSAPVHPVAPPQEDCGQFPRDGSRAYLKETKAKRMGRVLLLTTESAGKDKEH